MKPIPSISACLASLWLAACATEPVTQEAALAKRPGAGSAAERNVLHVTDHAGKVTIEKVPHRAGTSSVTVEKLARSSGCSGPAAGLITEKGPVEVYRMQCDDGRVFLARCELRQCRPMR